MNGDFKWFLKETIPPRRKQHVKRYAWLADICEEKKKQTHCLDPAAAMVSE